MRRTTTTRQRGWRARLAVIAVVVAVLGATAPTAAATNVISGTMYEGGIAVHEQGIARLWRFYRGNRPGHRWVNTKAVYTNQFGDYWFYNWVGYHYFKISVSAVACNGLGSEVHWYGEGHYHYLRPGHWNINTPVYSHIIGSC